MTCNVCRHWTRDPAIPALGRCALLGCHTAAGFGCREGGGGMSGPQPGDLWRPSVRHAETAAVENVEPDGTIHWRDRHGDVYRSSADAWREWVERTGARREVG